MRRIKSDVDEKAGEEDRQEKSDAWLPMFAAELGSRHLVGPHERVVPCNVLCCVWSVVALLIQEFSPEHKKCEGHPAGQ